MFERQWMRIAAVSLSCGLFGSGCIIQEDGFSIFDDEPESIIVGEDTSVFVGGGGSFSQPVRNIREENRGEFARGQALFRLDWSPQDVGPVFNAIACSDCHVNDGRAAPDTAGLLFRLSVPGPSPEPVYGSQLQPRGIREVPGEGDVVVSWETFTGAYPDGTSYELRRPEYRFVNLNYGPLAPDFEFSPRIAQQMIGLGLLEAIPESALLANEDATDQDGDGISGRANWVEDVRNSGVAMGRFGWKAGQPTVEQQNAAAFQGDLGMTNPLFIDGPCTDAQPECQNAILNPRELSTAELRTLTTYTLLIAPPGRRLTTLPQVERGEELFSQVQCAACHVPRWQTGASELVELSDQTIRPFTDLLLHDMGDGLADNRPEAGADGNEWRTPPLWGVGLIERVNGHTFLLHDGRARNIEEAILWHGGEANGSIASFKALEANDRAALIRFVESL